MTFEDRMSPPPAGRRARGPRGRAPLVQLDVVTGRKARAARKARADPARVAMGAIGEENGRVLNRRSSDASATSPPRTSAKRPVPHEGSP